MYGAWPSHWLMDTLLQERYSTLNGLVQKRVIKFVVSRRPA